MSSNNSPITLSKHSHTAKGDCEVLEEGSDKPHLTEFNSLNDLNTLLDAHLKLVTVKFQSFEEVERKNIENDDQFDTLRHLDFLEVTDHVKFPAACLEYSLKKFENIKKAKVTLPSSSIPVNFNTLLKLSMKLLGKIPEFELKFKSCQEYAGFDTKLVKCLNNLDDISVSRDKVYTIITYKESN